MGWFSNVTDFLSSPAFRIGAGVAGLASGAGAFSGMGDWGTALQGLSGAANLAAGASSTFGPNRSTLDKATGALQLGLGGYNLGQSFGAVGSFGDVWNQIGGSSENSGQIPGYPGYDESVTRQALPPFPGQPTDPSTQSPFNGRAYPITSTVDAGRPFIEGGSGGGVSAGGTGFDPTQRQVAQITAGDVPSIWGPPPPAAAPGPTPLAPPPPDIRFDTAVNPPPTPAPTPAATPPTVPAGTPPATTPGMQPWVTPLPATAPPPAGNPGNTRTWLGRTWDNLAKQASESPIAAGMAAMQVGSMLVGLFAQSSSDIAKEAMERMDPNSPNGAEFRRLFEERARREIDEQAETARSGLEAKFAGRGMLRSTVYTNAVQSLETARTKLLVDLPYNSLKAWNETAVGSGNAMTATARLTAATAPRQDFSSIARVLGQSPFAQQVAAGSRTNTPARASTGNATLDELYP